MTSGYIIILPVYNSYDNLFDIFYQLQKSKILIKKVIIIDNNSNLSLNTKLSIIKKIRTNNKINLDLIINKQNYGIGGSQKIIFELLKNEEFNFIINLQTSGRFYVKEILDVVEKLNSEKLDYVIFSRFLKKDTAINYNFFRKIGNLIFSFLTKLFTKCKISDPGMAINLISFQLFQKIKINNKILTLTNDSHFPHLFNIVIFEDKFLFKEESVKWGEGNIKSHLSAVPYVLNLLIYLFKYLIFRKFKENKKDKFEYTIY